VVVENCGAAELLAKPLGKRNDKCRSKSFPGRRTIHIFARNSFIGFHASVDRKTQPSVGSSVFLGGRSYGGRQGTLLGASEPNLVDLLLLSYPLHPPRSAKQGLDTVLPRVAHAGLFRSWYARRFRNDRRDGKSTESDSRAAPYMEAGLLAALLTWVGVLCYFFGRDRAALGVAGVTILAILIIKIVIIGP
jgi:hypothetical protein